MLIRLSRFLIKVLLDENNCIMYTSGKFANETKQSIEPVKGHVFIFLERVIKMVDSYDKPARIMLILEGSFSGIIHIVKDKKDRNRTYSGISNKSYKILTS